MMTHIPFKVCSRYLFALFMIVINSMINSNVYALGTSVSLPRFVSIKSNEVNARVGPNLASSIEWIFVKKNEPVEVIAEYEQWRLIRDIKGEGGWVHSSVLSTKRFVIIKATEPVNITKSYKTSNATVAKITPMVRCALNKCKLMFCNITCKGNSGWISKSNLWGVYDKE